MFHKPRRLVIEIINLKETREFTPLQVPFQDNIHGMIIKLYLNAEQGNTNIDSNIYSQQYTAIFSTQSLIEEPKGTLNNFKYIFR